MTAGKDLQRLGWEGLALIILRRACNEQYLLLEGLATSNNWGGGGGAMIALPGRM